MNIFLVLGILLCILSRTSALVCTDDEYSITAKSVAKTLSYQQAISNCELDGKELCNSQTICQDGKTPYSGVLSGDHWVPVSDSPNEWVQIGNSPHSTCILHSSLGVKPLWGLGTAALNYKGNLYCCKIKEKDFSIAVKIVSNTISYQQAETNCQNDGKELCTSLEICEDGNTPNSGPLSGDHWVPVKDSLNEWLQIGNSPHSPCLLHSDLGSKPAWGTSTQSASYKGYLFCCV